MVMVGAPVRMGMATVGADVCMSYRFCTLSGCRMLDSRQGREDESLGLSADWLRVLVLLVR